ncbi:BatD family protein [Thalassotalea euphylliae]|uniref:BatD family protein n=1 Tax=Thalassotalea euphylliae TaxID=1655234 RepID=UPI0036403650
MVRIFLGFILFIFTSYTWALTQVTATVDRNPAVVNESFVLTTIADDDVDTNALDTSALENDFVVVRTSVSTQTSIINFKTSRTTKWQTLLIPKRAGNITIPALTIEGKQTSLISLTVLEPGQAGTSSQKDVFITTAISNNDVYVQQMVTLTIKLHFAAELKRGSLTEPALEGASIEQVGKDKESETTVNGRRYRVIERSFSIIPQRSGEFYLRSPMFSGEILVRSNSRSSFLSFGDSKAISVLGEELPITVKPKPTSYSGHWLPSELMTLHQEWQPSGSSFKVGDPITRTITLTAVGVSKEQLPELELALPTGLKVYPDQQTTHANITNGRYVSQSVSNFAIVATKPGEFTLPAVQVPWWNTITNRMETATLPAQTINVEPGELSEQRSFVPPTQTLAQPESYNATGNVETVYVTQSSWLQWLFLALWLLTSLAWFITYRVSNRYDATSDKPVDASSAQLSLMAACKKNDSSAVLSMIVPWFNQKTASNAKTIADVIAQCNNKPLIFELQQLQANLYSKNTAHWQGTSLLKIISQFAPAHSEKDIQDIKLNP